MNLDNAEIHGDVRMSGLLVPNTASFRNTRISGDVIAATAPHNRGRRREAPFRLDVRTADFSNSDIHGSVRLRGPLFRSLSLAAANVRGEIEIACEILSDTAAIPAEISGLDLSSAQIGASVICAGVKFGEFVLSAAKIAGSLVIQTGGALQSQIGNISAASLHAIGRIALAGLRVDNDVDLVGCQAPQLWIYPHDFQPEIGGKLHLSAISGGPYISVAGLRCGEVRVVASKLGPTHFKLGQIGEEIVLCEIGALTIRNSSIAGPLDLTHIQVNGGITDVGRQGVLVEQSSVAGDLTFWQPNWIEDIRYHREESGQNNPKLDLPGRCDHGAAVIGSVVIRNCTIDANCDLSFLKAYGPVSVENTNVRGNLCFRSVATVRTVLNDKGLDGLRSEHAPFRAVMPALSLHMTTVDKDVDLTGLTLHSGSNLAWCSEDQKGNCRASYLVVKAELLACVAGDSAHAVIPGMLDLSHSQASHLVLSSLTFHDENSPRAGNMG